MRTICRQADLIDLHIHSTYSDGEYTPNELIEKAIEKGIGTISITDHDTLMGNQNILDEGIIQIIPGIELSAKTESGRMHILGYGIDIYNEDLNKKMINLQNNSVYSVLSLIHQLKKDYGITFTTNDIQNLFNANHNIGRPDLARLCVLKGYASTSQEAFDKYLIEAYKKTSPNNKGLEYEECIDLILRAGGIPVLAHPKTLNKDYKELLVLIKEMIKKGLEGIEVYHSSHSEEQVGEYLELADRFNLLISGGSDFHGEFVKPDIELGTGKHYNLKIKSLSLLDKINMV